MNRRDALKAMSFMGGMAAFAGTVWAEDKQSPPKQPAARPGAGFNEAPIKTTKLAENVHLLSGPGGNMAVILGPSGAAVIDSGVPARAESILSAVGDLGGKNVRFLLNTHWHFDHTGGNDAFAKSGAVIVAHHNTRKRMAVPQKIAFMNLEMPASPTRALPVVTFGDTGTLHHDETVVEATYVPNAHTDTDAAYRLPQANVLHCGDLFFNGFYPFIDYSTGGSIDGMVSGVERVLELAGDDTQIIPGHGPMAKKPELKAFRDMLAQARDQINPLIQSGKALEEVVAAKPTRDLDEKWAKGFLKGDTFVTMIYQGAKMKK